jgi:hypothetical protein
MQEILVLKSNIGGIVERGDCANGNRLSPNTRTGIVLNTTANSNEEKATLGLYKLARS